MYNLIFDVITRSDVGVKHLVDFTSEKKGIASVIQLMQQYTNVR